MAKTEPKWLKSGSNNDCSIMYSKPRNKQQQKWNTQTSNANLFITPKLGTVFVTTAIIKTVLFGYYFRSTVRKLIQYQLAKTLLSTCRKVAFKSGGPILTFNNVLRVLHLCLKKVAKAVYPKQAFLRSKSSQPSYCFLY